MISFNIRHNIFTNATSNGAIRIYDGASGGDPKDLKIYGNIVYNTTVNGGFLIDSDLKNTLSLLMYNNTFYNAPVIIRRNSATVDVFEFRNNIIQFGGGTPLTDVDGVISAHSNNIYFRASGTLVSSRGANYTAATLGEYEASASGSDPLFVDVARLPTGFTGTYSVNMTPDSDGLHVRPGSFGIDRAVPLAGAYSTSIATVTRPVGSGWDIGAYEAVSVTASPPGAPTNLRVCPGLSC